MFRSNLTHLSSYVNKIRKFKRVRIILEIQIELVGADVHLHPHNRRFHNCGRITLEGHI